MCDKTYPNGVGNAGLRPACGRDARAPGRAPTNSLSHTRGRSLKRQAAALVLAHNQPNGNVQPSEQDKVITRAIVLAAGTIGLRVVDHLVVSAQETFSIRQAGLL